MWKKQTVQCLKNVIFRFSPKFFSHLLSNCKLGICGSKNFVIFIEIIAEQHPISLKRGNLDSRNALCLKFVFQSLEEDGKNYPLNFLLRESYFGKI